VQWPLPPTRGPTACPSIVAHITKADACSRCGRTLVFYSPNVGVGVFSEDEMRRPTPQVRSTLWVCKSHTGSNAQEGGSALEMDGSSEQPQMTAGLDLGDRYSYLCLIDTLRAAR
jgi:hypothetical protein